MRVVITGGAGFLGQKLAQALLARGGLAVSGDTPAPIAELVLFDTVAPPQPADRRVTAVAGDIADAVAMQSLIGPGTTVVFHLAAVVSAGAEADFDLGYRVNLDGTRLVLEACRALPSPARLVFASSVATYGGALPSVIDDDTPQRPETSYGCQKTIGELLVTDYSRKGMVDGRSLRLPTVAVRPGRPNRAASTWASSIVREPLSGEDAICPVAPDVAIALISPRRCVAALIRAAELPAAAFGASRSVLLPGLAVTAGELAEAMARHAGNRRLGRILWQRDLAIERIVTGWPRATASARAAALGFAGDGSIDEIVEGFIADELAPA